MPEFSQQNASGLTPENLFINLETAMKFFSRKSQIFESTEMKSLFALFKEKDIKETQLNQLDKLEKNTVALRSNNLNVLDVPLLRLRLTTAMKTNEQQIQKQVKTILENNLYKAELRRLPDRNLQLMDIQKQLAEAFSEEIISEEEAQKFKLLIKEELDILRSEPIDKLYIQDIEDIYPVPISKSELPYLKNLVQVNGGIKKAEIKIDNYPMEEAERLIEKNSKAVSQNAEVLLKKNSLNVISLEDRIVFYENESMPALYTDSVEQINELILNGANPVRESKDLDGSPLEYQFSKRYEIKQSLNGIKIAKMCLKTAQKESSKEFEIGFKNQKKHLKTEAAALKLELQNNAALIKAQIGGLILRNPGAEASQYPDIARSEKYQSLWNVHQQEVLKMKQTPLTETFTVHDFLTDNLEKLPVLSPKTLKSLGVQFPHYASLLQMQGDMLNNYRLVQGPRPVKPTTEVRLPSISNHSLKDSASESKSETPIVLPTIETSVANGQSQRASPKKNYSRLKNSVFFGGSLQAKSESVSEKTSERNSRLNGSLFFAMAKAPSDLNVAKEKSIDRTIYIPDSIKLV